MHWVLLVLELSAARCGKKRRNLALTPDLEPPLPKRHLRWTFGMPDAERE